MSHFGVRLVSLFTLICMKSSTSGILPKKISECHGFSKLLAQNYVTKVWHPLLTRISIDRIDNIRAEFTLLEANLRSYLFLSMDYIMPGCTISLDNFGYATDIELKNYFWYE